MRLLVTGATGFLGRHLLPALRRAGHESVALLLPDERPPVWLTETEAAVVRGDITRAETLSNVASGCDGVVHLAAAVGYGQQMDHCLRVNRDGTANVARAAEAAGARRFVQLSSVSVYGRTPDVRIDESAPLRKTGDPYGDTKIDAEEILAASSSLAVTCLRPTVIYGPGDVRFLGKLVENLRSGKAAVVGSGNNSVDAIHVLDVVPVVVRVLETPASIGRAYNLNHPGNPTWNALVTHVAGLLGVPAPTRHVPYPLALALAGALEVVARLSGKEPRLTRYAVRVIGRQYRYAVDRACDELGFSPRVELLAGVAELLKAPRPEAASAPSADRRPTARGG
jgi:nucleoside-diphosphate-sugar epimerase